MTTIIGLSGSLRKGSYNTALLAAAKAVAPAGVTLDRTSRRLVARNPGVQQRHAGRVQECARLAIAATCR